MGSFVGQQGTSMEPQSPVDGSMRKRVCKACDRCRLKKSKCDGFKICGRCRADNAICVFGERKKSHEKIYPKGYVEMLEQQQAQLVAGLQELYRRTQDGQGWDGAPLKESSHGIPLTHDILERLGALKPGADISEPQQFEEDLESLQRRLLANGAGFIQRTPSDSGSDSGHSPAFEQVTQNVPFAHPFSISKLPPTPPSGSPFPLNASPVLEVKNLQENNPSTSHKALANSLLQRQLWTSSDMAFDDNMSVLDQYDSPINLNAIPNAFDTAQMPIGTIAPYLSMRDWNHEVDFQRYFSSATM